MKTNQRSGPGSRMHSRHPSCRINTHFRKFFLLRLPFLYAFWHVNPNAPRPELPEGIKDCNFLLNMTSLFIVDACLPPTDVAGDKAGWHFS